ncbi:MAG: ribose-phosphate pyrophosphokinase [Candidatus Korarchaeota archaeon NZ13-K]|nr:MAG: ribose-phosphate pyrophosphokinase [Candidatus Korarchaeota archaeon NZ13-K]
MLVVGPQDDFNVALSRELGVRLVPVERRVFPDGEVCPRVMGRVDGESILLSMRMSAGNCRPNDYLMEVLLTLRNLKEHMKAGRVIVLMPYFPYSRQDSIFREGEPLSSKYVINLLEESGADSIVTVTAHLHRLRDLRGLSIRADFLNLSGFKPLAEELRRLPLKDPFILGPDTESINWARELAEYYGAAEYDSLEKERDVSTGEIRTFVKSLDLEGRDVIVVDDIVSTGGTMANALTAARRMGARYLVASFVHPVLVPGSLERILRAGADILVATDTIEWAGSRASVVPVIAEALRSGGLT